MQAAQNGADVVAAAGGDGTLSEVMNGLLQASTDNRDGKAPTLGLVPTGTGNDFARCLGLSLDWQAAVPLLFKGTPRLIDVGYIKFETTGDELRFLNIAGCGFDALAAQRVNDFRHQTGWRHLCGTPAYLAAVFQELTSLRAATLSISCDGQTHELRALMCAVANATSYGGGMLVAPAAKLDDGLLDICLIAEAGRVEFLRAFPGVFKGTHVSHPKVTMLQGREIRIDSDPPLPVLVDGDVRGFTPVSFRVTPAALNIMAPHGINGQPA